MGTLQIAGAGTFGDLAVITGDGRYVYATFDAGTGGTGGVAVVDVRRRKVVDTWAYPGTGRPHGIWYSRRKLRLPRESTEALMLGVSAARTWVVAAGHTWS